MALYLITFILGLVLDYVSRQNKVNVVLRNLYLIWFFIFSCFGYMTGSDWRNYELAFYSQAEYDGEIGFTIIYKVMFFLTHDFWLAEGILKCLYLFTLIRWLNILTPYWMSILAITILNTDLYGLGFMLIDCPLRFMVASIFVNVAIEFLLKKKSYFLSIVFLVLAVLCHNSTLFFLVVLIPIFLFSHHIYKVNRVVLVLLYVGLIAFASVSENLQGLKDGIILAIQMGASEFEGYSSYNVEDTSTLFGIGSMVKYFLFICLLLTKKYIVTIYPEGKFLYSITVLFFFFERLLVVIPTGSRLLLPFNFFVVLYFIMLLRNRRVVGYAYVFLMMVTSYKNIWNSYQYIPYSNSIYYIITEHKPYTDRSNHNLIELTKRTGKQHEIQ